MKGIGQKIIDFSNLYFTETQRVSKNGGFDITIDQESETFVFHLLDKMMENYYVVGELLRQSEQPHLSFLKNPMYLVLRGLLSDVIITSWIFHKDDKDVNDVESINEKVKKIKRDHLRFHLSYMQQREQHGLLPADEKNYDIKIINTEFKDLLVEEIKTDLNIKSLPKGISISNMLDENTKTNIVLTHAHFNYFLLSKVEHTGAFTKIILERSYGNENPMDKFIEDSIATADATIKTLIPIYFEDKVFLQKIKSFEIFSNEAVMQN